MASRSPRGTSTCRRPSAPRRRSSAGRCSPPGRAGRRANDRPRRCATRCGGSSRPSRWRTWSTSRWPTGRPSRSSTAWTAPPPLAGGPLRHHPPHRQRAAPRRSRPGLSADGGRSSDLPGLPRLLRRQRGVLPVPAGLLPRPRPEPPGDRPPDGDPGRDPAGARPDLGRPRRSLSADAADPAAGRARGDGRRHRSLRGNRLPGRPGGVDAALRRAGRHRPDARRADARDARTGRPRGIRPGSCHRIALVRALDARGRAAPGPQGITIAVLGLPARRSSRRSW